MYFHLSALWIVASSRDCVSWPSAFMWRDLVGRTAKNIALAKIHFEQVSDQLSIVWLGWLYTCHIWSVFTNMIIKNRPSTVWLPLHIDWSWNWGRYCHYTVVPPLVVGGKSIPLFDTHSSCGTDYRLIVRGCLRTGSSLQPWRVFSSDVTNKTAGLGGGA